MFLEKSECIYFVSGKRKCILFHEIFEILAASWIIKGIEGESQLINLPFVSNIVFFVRFLFIGWKINLEITIPSLCEAKGGTSLVVTKILFIQLLFCVLGPRYLFGMFP